MRIPWTANHPTDSAIQLLNSWSLIENDLFSCRRVSVNFLSVSTPIEKSPNTTCARGEHVHQTTKNDFDHRHQSQSVSVDAWGLCMVSFCGVVQTRVGKGDKRSKGNSYLVSVCSLLQPQFSKKLTQHLVIVNETLSPGALSFLIFKAKNKALFNICSFLKQKVKSCNAKWRRQRKQP